MALSWWEKSRIHQLRQGSSASGVQTVTENPGVTVDNTDPANPVVGANISTDTPNLIRLGTDDGLLVEDAPSDGTTYGRNNNAWVAAGGGSSPLTTKGDLYGYDTADARIPVGTDDLPLVADSSTGLGVAYKQIPVASLAGGSATKGDILVFDGTDWVEHTHGSNGQLIQFDSLSSAGLRNVTVPSIPYNTLADEILADSPTSYYKCDETSGSVLIDYGSAGINLTIGAGSQLAASRLLPTDDAKYFTPRYQGAGYGASASGVNPAGVSVYSGSWTMEAVINIPRPNTANVYENILIIQGALTNHVASLAIYNGVPRLLWWFGASPQFPTDVNYYCGEAGTYHLVVVKDAASKTVTFYYNGNTNGPPITYTNESNQTMTGSSFLGVGVDGAGGSFFPFGNIGHVAFYYGTMLSEARVIAHAKAAGKYCL